MQIIHHNTAAAGIVTVGPRAILSDSEAILIKLQGNHDKKKNPKIIVFVLYLLVKYTNLSVYILIFYSYHRILRLITFTLLTVNIIVMNCYF